MVCVFHLDFHFPALSGDFFRRYFIPVQAVRKTDADRQFLVCRPLIIYIVGAGAPVQALAVLLERFIPFYVLDVLQRRLIVNCTINTRIFQPVRHRYTGYLAVCLRIDIHGFLFGHLLGLDKRAVPQHKTCYDKSGYD